LGVLLLIKLFIREAKGYPAPRWDHFSTRSGTLSRRRSRGAGWLTRVLIVLTLAVLAECLVSAWNVAANYNSWSRIFEYHHYIPWLPHSLDGGRTWDRLWMYLALAGAFWAVRDWLAGMTSAEERRVPGGRPLSEQRLLFPARLRLLLWVLCVNGALVGIEAVVQRLSGTNKLLFLVVPVVHIQGETQFGPYAYRSNAAQYFNLVWPVCLGFWLTLQRIGNGRSKAHHWLLVCAAIMAACPIISTSRAGALVSVSMLLIAYVYIGLTSISPPPKTDAKLVFQKEAMRRRETQSLDGTGLTTGSEISTEGASTSHRGSEKTVRPSPPGRLDGGGRGTLGWLTLFLVVSLGLGWYFGWDALFPRLQQIGEGYAGREDMYTAALPMAKDYPLFGTGPGTFGTVFQLYRYSDEVFWAEQLHNDWLETRITFGWLGLGLLLAALAVVWVRWFLPGGMRAHQRLVVLAWISLAGCLITARFDFPFQLHSTLFLFLLICAMLFNFGRHAGSSRE
jgi:O-antigen ligase